jgi:UDP-3-O-[3-hydroxymyristoyl] N-acetylglucosamine deacetylase
MLTRSEIELHGVGLHQGQPCCLWLRRCSQASRWRSAGQLVPWNQLVVQRTDWGVCVRLPTGQEIDLVEHLLAAVAGLGAWWGLEIEVEGSEVPLLDGGAVQFSEAIQRLGIPYSPNWFPINRSFSLQIGTSSFQLEPHPDFELAVDIDFEHPAIGYQQATWNGKPSAFLDTIAKARTFGFYKDHHRLVSQGRAQGIQPDSMIVFDELGIVDGFETKMKDEPVHHKLLDLIGDMAMFGGLPQGKIHASRPGHTANHRLMKEAFQAGVLDSLQKV